jgi:hypothetical protein
MNEIYKLNELFDSLYANIIVNAKEMSLKEIMRQYNSALEYKRAINTIQTKISVYTNFVSGYLHMLNKTIKEYEQNRYIELPDSRTQKALISDIKIPVLEINDESEIPNTNIYYLKNSNQYAVKICNQVITGDLCELVRIGKTQLQISEGDFVFGRNRKVGNKNTLVYDIGKLSINDTKKQSNLYRKCIMHDILVYFILNCYMSRVV